MAYLTQAEFLEQSIPGEAFSGLPSTAIDNALVWASAIADSYLTKRYQLPLVQWNEDLKSAVGEIAQFKLLSRRGFRPVSGNDEISVKRYDDAIAWLRDISTGTIALANAIDSTPQVDEEGSLSSSERKISFRTFTGPSRHNDGDFEDDPL